MRGRTARAATLDIVREGAHCRAILESRHLDVIEMDAASHTGIDDVRELINSAHYKPNAARYKVYIIDEVHMLSKQAFNGLLKTLEEPPEHVKFIFATTEMRKVPVTVLSRCQRFDLRRIEIETLMDHLAAHRERGERRSRTCGLGAHRPGRGRLGARCPVDLRPRHCLRVEHGRSGHVARIARSCRPGPHLRSPGDGAEGRCRRRPQNPRSIESRRRRARPGHHRSCRRGSCGDARQGRRRGERRSGRERGGTRAHRRSRQAPVRAGSGTRLADAAEGP